MIGAHSGIFLALASMSGLVGPWCFPTVVGVFIFLIAIAYFLSVKNKRHQEKYCETNDEERVLLSDDDCSDRPIDAVNSSATFMTRKPYGTRPEALFTL